MKYRNLFPFKNRKLSLSEKVFTKDESLLVESLSLICIANLAIGDNISFTKGSIEVTSIASDFIEYLFLSNTGDEKVPQKINAKDIASSPLFSGIVDKIFEFNNYQNNEVGKILERDPAVFRLATKKGWVINSDLCLMSGNVSYVDFNVDDDTAYEPALNADVNNEVNLELSLDCDVIETTDKLKSKHKSNTTKKVKPTESQISFGF